MPKSHTRNHHILPTKSVNARRAAYHNRKLNVVDHNQFVIRSLKSVNTKTPQAKHSVNHTKQVWKATRNHNVNTTKTAWRPTRKVVGSVKPQWKPTGRYFALYDNCPLTRIMEPIVEPLELTPSVSSSSKVTMISRFTDCKLSDRKAGSKGLSGQKDVLLLILLLKVWKATRNHNVNTTKTAWRPTGKVVGSVKPQWKPTGRHFALYDNCPLTRIMEPIVEPLELTPSVSSSSKVTMISRSSTRTASIRKSDTSVLEDLKALSWKTCQEGSLLNLSDHRLFKHVVSVSPELAFDHYLSHDRAMHPLAPHYERKTRADRGKKRPREPNASSSSPL
ncbi:hypothetical protein Tco_1269731 [Tanacetum coccineum]